GALNSTILKLGDLVSRADTVKTLKVLFDGSRTAVRNLGAAFVPLVQVFLDVASVGARVFGDLTAGAERVTQRFADFVRQAKDSGKLESWMRGGIDAFRDLFRLLGDVASIVTSVFGALREGGAGVAPIL